MGRPLIPSYTIGRRHFNPSENAPAVESNASKHLSPPSPPLKPNIPAPPTAPSDASPPRPSSSPQQSPAANVTLSRYTALITHPSIVASHQPGPQESQQQRTAQSSPLCGTHHSVPRSSVPLSTATIPSTIGVVIYTGLPQSPQKFRYSVFPESVALSSNVLGVPEVRVNVFRGDVSCLGGWLR